MPHITGAIWANIGFFGHLWYKKTLDNRAKKLKKVLDIIGVIWENIDFPEGGGMGRVGGGIFPVIVGGGGGYFFRISWQNAPPPSKKVIFLIKFRL